MKRRRTAGETAFEILNVTFLVLLVLATLYPFVHVLSASVSDSASLAAHRGPLLAPLSLSAEAYKAVFANPNILSGYRNTLLYLVVGTTINMTLTSLGAYALSRRRMLLRDFIMFAVTFTMMFRGGLIPTYILVKQLGMVDSLWALTVPSAVSTMNLIIMRTSFQAIPDSLEESAKMDGANDLVIFARIALPLSMAVVAVMILFYSVYHWDSWFPAAIYIRTREKWPLQLVLREILIQNQTDNMMTGAAARDDRASIETTIKYATIVVSTLPILAVYPMLQKYFVKGVMIGAIKG